MKNICTFETACALKAARFPQPAPEFGQFWYDGEALNCIGFGDFTIHFLEMSMYGYIYAPSAADILRQFEDATLFYDYRIDKFKCSAASNREKVSWFEAEHEESAEALASAWLALHSKE